MRKNYARILAILSVMLVIFFLTKCNDDPIIKDGGTHAFSGIVRDSATGLAIDSAWIDIGDSILPHHVYSDSNGYYILRVQGTEQFMVFCGKEGYNIEDTVIRVVTDLDSINFFLQAE